MILDLPLYTTALKLAEVKNPQINYQILQKNTAWALAYNYVTRDAYFIRRLDATGLPDGYYLAYPQTRGVQQCSLKAIRADLADPEIGWPAIAGV